MNDTKHISIDENNFCTWRLTPWDTRIFNFKTAEILNITYTDKLQELFELVEAGNVQNGIRLCYFRADSNDQMVKKIATNRNFAIKEFSLYAYHNDVTKIKKVNLNLEFVKITEEDIPEVKAIAAESFKHGRFHEDPAIDFSLAKKRYEVWIDTLVKETNFYVFKLKNRVAGFFNYVIDDGWIEMPLSGLSVDAQKLGGFMWVLMFYFIYEKEGIKKIKNLISGSNINVLNIYSNLGFYFGDPLFGYHKYYI